MTVDDERDIEDSNPIRLLAIEDPNPNLRSEFEYAVHVLYAETGKCYYELVCQA